MQECIANCHELCFQGLLLDRTCNEYWVKCVSDSSVEDPRNRTSNSLHPSHEAAATAIQHTILHDGRVPPAAVKLCTSILARHLLLILCVVDTLVFRGSTAAQLADPIFLVFAAITVAVEVCHVVVTTTLDSLPSRTTLASILQV